MAANTAVVDARLIDTKPPPAKAILDLAGAERVFEVRWFNPRTGGDLQLGSSQAVSGGGKVNLGQPPTDSDQDWLVILSPGDPNREYPPG